MNTRNNILGRKRVNLLIDELLNNRKAVFIYAEDGYGKTCVLLNYCSEYKNKALYIDCIKENIKDMYNILVNNDLVILDNFEALDQEERLKFTESNYFSLNAKLVFSSNKKPCGKFSSWIIKNELGIINKLDLNFTEDEIKDFFALNEINIEQNTVQELYKLTNGYAYMIAIALTEAELNNRNLNIDILYTSQFVKDFFENQIWAKLEQSIKVSIIKLSVFESFTEEQAKYILEYDSISKLIEKIHFINKKDNILSYNRLFLKLIEEKYEDYIDFINDSFNKMGEYYEEKEKYIEAAHMYQKAKKYIAEAKALTKFTNTNSLTDNMKEIRIYLQNIPLELIKNNIVLCSLKAAYEIFLYNLNEAGKWISRIDELQTFYKNNTEIYEDVREIIYGRLLFISSMYPGYNTDFIKKKCIESYSNNIKSEYSAIFNCTLNFPSIIRGFKDDVYTWEYNDKYDKESQSLLAYMYNNSYDHIKAIAQCEIDYEKDNLTDCILNINDKLYKVKDNCKAELLFVIKILHIKILLASGNVKTAQFLIEKEKIFMDADEKISMVNKNFEAFYVRYKLLNGNIKYATEWLEKYNNLSERKFNLLNMYEYFTKVRVYIATNKYDDAIGMLTILYNLNSMYNHEINMAECRILQAVCLLRKKEEKLMIKIIDEAIQIIKKYKFIRIIADEAYAGYEIINYYIHNKSIIDKDELKYLKDILLAAKKMSVMYPKYLSEILIDETNIILTKSEKKIAELVSFGLSNNEISYHLDVKVDTVKFHIKNIYVKLNVNRRVDMVNKLKKNNLFL